MSKEFDFCDDMFIICSFTVQDFKNVSNLSSILQIQ